VLACAAAFSSPSLVRSDLIWSSRDSAALPACCTAQGGNTALMMAASVACPRMVKFLLSKGADMWRQNQVRAPCPLHSSVPRPYPP
jgi:hypothetical protein